MSLVKNLSSLKLNDSTTCYFYLVLVLKYWLKKYDISNFIPSFQKIIVQLIVGDLYSPSKCDSKVHSLCDVYGLKKSQQLFENLKNRFKYPKFLRFHFKNHIEWVFIYGPMGYGKSSLCIKVCFDYMITLRIHEISKISFKFIILITEKFLQVSCIIF